MLIAIRAGAAAALVSGITPVFHIGRDNLVWQIGLVDHELIEKGGFN
jgi:hypothetical protein